ncbi:polysaccharide pyruvyl transferase family protein [Georgenia muralis]|uniref:Polysaccharide pyruvyl transferase n=1 Tax=Georgenia muralis TaxID=154117 RepID=A0A3N4Z3H1_9MICO|nr:polysaccharide pyruvyl transferase family protein [Georgenia muralis]RPF26394.1 polysaccharide pyruvyl transferase [Georgenia muralis]
MGYLSTAALYPRSPTVRTYWWDEVPNFGDQLTPYLLARYGVAALPAGPSDCDLVGIGSLLQTMPTGFSGTIWGSGSLTAEVPSLPRATIIGLRGELTRSALGGPEVIALGDPALLVARVLQRPYPRYDLGIVPNFAHKADRAITALAANDAGVRVKVIDPQQHPAKVVREIASCRAVVTSSLHGLIVADAYGVPAAWTLLEPTWDGADHKFLDHESVAMPSTSRRVDLSPTTSARTAAGWTQRANRRAVDHAIDQLHRSVPSLVAATPHRVASPWSLALHLPGLVRPGSQT